MKRLPDFGQCKLMVVGDVMLDRYWFGDVNRISPEAPVPVVQVRREENRPGGAANVARNIASLGGQVRLLSVVGDDEAAGTLETLLANEKVTASLRRDAALKTTVKLRVVGHRQQLLRIDFEEAPSHEVLDSKLGEFEERIDEADAVVLSDYGKGGLTHVARMIEICRDHQKPVLVDPKGSDYSRYHGATLITPNRAEFREVAGRWTNEQDLTHRAQALRKSLDLEALIVTRSEEGMSLYTADGAKHEATQAREVFDVSGAGDTVIGTLALMMASGADLAEAMHIANRAAGIVVGKLGTATVSREELLNDLKARP
jgi:D-glycero-beta-D-manno-heptose-7-phosphate kinase